MTDEEKTTFYTVGCMRSCVELKVLINCSCSSNNTSLKLSINTTKGLRHIYLTLYHTIQTFKDPEGQAL